MNELDRIWNRATTDAPLSQAGDRALQAVHLVHSQVMNGGLLSALDYIDYDQIERAAAGLDYFGIPQGADALRTALEIAFPDGPVAADEREDHTLALPQPVLDRIEGELEDQYAPTNDVLYDALARRHRERPSDFDPA